MDLMKKTWRPYANSEMLLQYGTDIAFEGRFVDTLSYNNFKQKDEQNLTEVAKILEKSMDEAAEVIEGYLEYLQLEEGQKVDRKQILVYLTTFLTKKRDKSYVDEVIPFFQLLKEKGYNVGKLIVAFNQLNFFYYSFLLSKKGLTPKKCLTLMESLQRAINIDQQVLIEVFTEKLMEDSAKQISGLIDKNAEIMFIKDFLSKLNTQDEEVQTITAAGEQLTASVDEVAKYAISVAEKTEETVTLSEDGKEVIEKALEEIIHTKEQFIVIVTKVKELQESVRTIEQVIEIVRGIADQTNLLALNASIEAARAGDAGKGFAVVASEVRKLAENTVESLQTVTDKVDTLQQVSDEISSFTTKTTSVIEEGVSKAQNALPMLSLILNRLFEINKSTNNTAATAQQQSSAVTDVANRMVSIAEITQDVRELGEKTGKAVYELSQLTDSFRTSFFSSNIHLSTRTLLELAKSDHILWKWKIYNMIIGIEQVKPEDVASHQDCRLGKWYFDPATMKRIQSSKSYIDLDSPHQLVHEYAKNAATAYANGNIIEAERYLSQLEEASQRVLILIDRIIEELEI